MKMDYFNWTKHYAEKYNVPYIYNKNIRAYSIMKEKIGERFIDNNNLFPPHIRGVTGYEYITDRDLQLSGVDVIVKTNINKDVYIDIKVCIGEDYSMKTTDYIGAFANFQLQMPIGIAIELQNKDRYGNWHKTFTKNKKTDYLLFIVLDKNGEHYNLINYKQLCNYIEKHSNEYTKYLSNEGTAEYIKVPLNIFNKYYKSN